MGHLSRTRGKLHLPCAERIYIYYKASTVCVIMVKYQFKWQKILLHLYLETHTCTPKRIHPLGLTGYNKHTPSLMICTEMQSKGDHIKALKLLRPECSKHCITKMCCYTTYADSPQDLPHSSKHMVYPICKPSSPLDYPALAH